MSHDARLEVARGGRELPCMDSMQRSSNSSSVASVVSVISTGLGPRTMQRRCNIAPASSTASYTQTAIAERSSVTRMASSAGDLEPVRGDDDFASGGGGHLELYTVTAAAQTLNCRTLLPGEA